MANYILFLSEKDKLTKLLETKKKEDTLFVLYPEGEDQVSVSVISAIGRAACSVEFTEYKKCIADNKAANIAYIYGLLTGKHGNLDTSYTDDPVIKSFAGEKPVKKTRKPRQPKEEPFMPEPVVETKAEEPAPAVTKAAKSRKSAPKPAVKPDAGEKGTDDDFEKNYSAFEKYLESLKTDRFNPSVYTGTVIKAVKGAEKEKMSIEEALVVWCNPSTGKKLAEILKGKEAEVKELVAKISE